MVTPLVSIIMPTYNREKYLPFAIDSVITQTFNNFEMIIVDDGSSDNTKQLIEQYKNDKRIRYFYQENQGQSVARNVGLKQANGKYICFLDSDDLFMPEKLAKQVAFLENNPEIAITHSDEELIDENGHVFSTYNMERYSGILYEKLLIDNCISITTAMVRRECFEELGMFDETVKVADDYELWLRFSTKYKFHYEAQYFAKYRVMKNQLSSDKTARFNSNKRIIENFFTQFPDLINTRKQNYFRCRLYTRWGNETAATSDLNSALHHYVTALKHDFFCHYPWKGIIKLAIKFIRNK